MGGKTFTPNKFIVFVCLFAVVSVFAKEARAVDILEARVKRLYREAETLAGKGDYDGAIEAYNKAILMAKDRDIRQFLINAKRAIQRQKRAENGNFRVFRIEENPEDIFFKPMAGGAPEGPGEKAGLEGERTQLESGRKEPEAEKVEPEEEMQTEEAAEENARQLPEADAESTGPEERQGAEAGGNICESSFYGIKAREILCNVQDKIRDASVKLEEKAALERAEAKLNELIALDRQAETLAAEGEYEKAKGICEKILSMSNDTDLKEYIKRQKGDD